MCAAAISRTSNGCLRQRGVGAQVRGGDRARQPETADPCVGWTVRRSEAGRRHRRQHVNEHTHACTNGFACSDTMIRHAWNPEGTRRPCTTTAAAGSMAAPLTADQACHKCGPAGSRGVRVEIWIVSEFSSGPAPKPAAPQAAGTRGTPRKLPHRSWGQDTAGISNTCGGGGGSGSCSGGSRAGALAAATAAAMAAAEGTAAAAWRRRGSHGLICRARLHLVVSGLALPALAALELVGGGLQCVGVGGWVGRCVWEEGCVQQRGAAT